MKRLLWSTVRDGQSLSIPPMLLVYRATAGRYRSVFEGVNTPESVLHGYSAHRDQKRVSGLLELELQMIVNHHVVAET